MFYLAFLGAVVVLATGVGWVQRSPVMSALARQLVDPKPAEEVFGEESLTLLIIGCDADLEFTGRNYEGDSWTNRPATVRRKNSRADMILVAKLDFANRSITGLSIPRDLGVRMPGYRFHKINAFHRLAPEGEGGELTKNVIEFLLPEIQIDRVVVLDYDAFQAMVNAVGGVPIVVDKPMHYDDYAGGVHIHFDPGKHLLDGYQAMMYVRYRHGDSDFMRQERQKSFLTAFKDRAMEDKFRLPVVLNHASEVMENQFKPDEIAGIAFFAQQVPPENIKFGQLPVRPRRGTTALALDEDKAAEAIREYKLSGANPSTAMGSRR